MTCPCGGPTFVRDSKVVHAKQAGRYLWRRRKCGACGARFTTNEREGVEERAFPPLGRPRMGCIEKRSTEQHSANGAAVEGTVICE